MLSASPGNLTARRRLAAGALVAVALGIGWFLFLRSDGPAWPDQLAGRPSISVDLDRETRLQLQQMGIDEPSVRAYGPGGVADVGVIRATVKEGFDLVAVLRSAAAFGGARVSSTPLAGPSPWTCLSVSGAGGLWPGIVGNDVRICQLVR